MSTAILKVEDSTIYEKPKYFVFGDLVTFSIFRLENHSKAEKFIKAQPSIKPYNSCMSLQTGIIINNLPVNIPVYPVNGKAVLTIEEDTNTPTVKYLTKDTPKDTKIQFVGKETNTPIYRYVIGMGIFKATVGNVMLVADCASRLELEFESSRTTIYPSDFSKWQIAND